MCVRVGGSEVNVERGVLEIYIQGCYHACKGCHNPELQYFFGGYNFREWLRTYAYKIDTPIIRQVWLLGGDLMCYPPILGIEPFLNALSDYEKPLTLFTGVEDIQEIPEEIRKHFAYIKTGRYKQHDTSIVRGGIALASSNQKLWKQDKDGQFSEIKS